MTSNLLKATLVLLGDKPKEEWSALAEELGCTYTWLVQLHSGKIAEPGVNKVEALYNKLSKSELKIK